MQRVTRATVISAVLALMLASLAAPVSAQAPSAYLTNGLTLNGLKQVQLGGYPGVEANFTNSYPFSFTAILYMDIMNSKGQTVSVSAGTSTFGANATLSSFLAVQPGVATGNYTAVVFAASTTGAPVSIAGSLHISL